MPQAFGSSAGRSGTSVAGSAGKVGLSAISGSAVQNRPNLKRAEPNRQTAPLQKHFEPVIKHEDAKEDLSIGELNPYTGHEYQTNSVRMHPSRLGYVQVYDRNLHKWTDMTEWAFLGYQERKKALLGRDYEPPIYLD